VNPEDTSVPEMILYLRSLVKSKPRAETLSGAHLFEEQRSRRAMICLFLAILEMVRLQAIVAGAEGRVRRDRRERRTDASTKYLPRTAR